MKPERDATDEYFEYDAEEFLVSLTLLITEGRTPECSVKGRTEGLHCPPTQLTQPAHTRHECSDKIPQCRQARRTRSEVMLLWRNNIPVMIEVMLLPDCCYSDEGPTTDGNDLNDPAIKQDALLLERWTMQPVPRQSGDRFIEEKTLLLAVRSYVFFSQLSAWLSASHGIVPRNILYRISAADEELVWQFSQPPAEHAFPVPNISHSVALKVRVQSLPRQPNYPVLKCSIHTSLTFYEKRGRDWDAREVSQHRGQSSSPFLRPSHSPVRPGGGSSRISQRPEVLPPDKAAKLLYPRLTSSPDDRPLEGYGTSINGAESSKGLAPEVPVRAFKSLSLVEPMMTASPVPRPPLGETNPLIGSLLQERQEVIARIAQHLNYCAPSTPHIPDSLFTGMETQVPKSLWCPAEGDAHVRKVKENTGPSYVNGSLPEQTPNGMGRSSASETPLRLCNKPKANSESRPSPKLSTCRKLLLPDPAENPRISDVVQDISRLIQETIQQSHGRCNKLLLGTHMGCKEGTPNTTHRVRDACSASSRHKDQAPGLDVSPDLLSANGVDSNICTGSRSGSVKVTNNVCQENSHKPHSVASVKLDAAVKQELNASGSLHNDKRGKSVPSNSQQRALHSEDTHEQNLKMAENISSKGTAHPKDPKQKVHAQDENKDPSAPTLLTSLPQRRPSPERKANNRTPNGDVLKINAPSALKPCNMWKKQNRHSIDGTATKAFHPCTGLPLLSSPVPQRRTQTGCFDLDTSLIRCDGLPWASNRRMCLKRETERGDADQHQLSASAPPASLSLLGNFEECVLNYRLEPLGTVEGFTAEVGASGTFCPSHLTLPVDVSFYSVSDDNAPSPYMTLFNPNKTVVKMFVVIYDLREMPANHQTFLRQRTFSVPVKREANGYVSKKPLPLSQDRTLRYLIHLRFQSSKSGKIYLHRDIRLLFSRKSMEVDSGAAYELKSFTESPADPPFSPRC
uniref:Atos homolog protein A n=1 Tax=Scleropages formosus TaxID=113540 RepID=A0A8C9SI17_SCLFO